MKTLKQKERRNAKLASLVLDDGWTQAAAAERYHVTRQRAHQVVEKHRRKRERGAKTLAAARQASVA